MALKPTALQKRFQIKPMYLYRTQIIIRQRLTYSVFLISSTINRYLFKKKKKNMRKRSYEAKTWVKNICQKLMLGQIV